MKEYVYCQYCGAIKGTFDFFLSKCTRCAMRRWKGGDIGWEPFEEFAERFHISCDLRKDS